MDNNVMTSEAFFGEINRSPKQRYAFVLGNGINYYLRNSVVSWKELLDNFIEVHKNSLEELSFASQSKDVTNTEIVNLIEVFADKEIRTDNPAAEMREMLMQFLKKRLSFKTPSECALLDAAWEKHHILTTNFDESIEKYISRSIKRRLKCCKAEARNKDENNHSNNGRYPWHRFWGLENCPKERNPLDHHNTIWHIHGKLNNKKTSCSVLFSLTRYVNAIKHVEQWKLPSADNWPGRNTWVNIFYNEPLIIAGLGLENQEVFLRTLLIERNRHWKRQKKDGKIEKEPKSYYLVRKTADDKKTDGREFLRALGFKVVEFDDTEDMYNNENWYVNSK